MDWRKLEAQFESDVFTLSSKGDIEGLKRAIKRKPSLVLEKDSEMVIYKIQLLIII